MGQRAGEAWSTGVHPRQAGREVPDVSRPSEETSRQLGVGHPMGRSASYSGRHFKGWAHLRQKSTVVLNVIEATPSFE